MQSSDNAVECTTKDITVNKDGYSIFGPPETGVATVQ